MTTSKADKPAIRTQVRAWVEKRVAVTFTGVSPFLRRHCGLSPGHRLPAPWMVDRAHVQFVLSSSVLRVVAHGDEAERVRRRRDARLGARARPRAGARRPRAGARPRAVCSIVPTSVRTMWRRNESASTRNSELVAARAPSCAARTTRRKTSCCVSAGVKARKSCSPEQRRAHRPRACSCERSRGQCQVRAARSGEGARERSTRYS